MLPFDRGLHNLPSATARGTDAEGLAPELMQVTPACTGLSTRDVGWAGRGDSHLETRPLPGIQQFLCSPHGRSSKEVLSVWPVSHGFRDVTGFSAQAHPGASHPVHTLFSLVPRRSPVACSLAVRNGVTTSGGCRLDGSQVGCQVTSFFQDQAAIGPP